jgi:CBS domain-containing protein
MFAKDIMTREVITVRPQTPVKDVSTLLVQHRISATPVVDAEGHLLGIVSEADLISKKGKQARAIMSKRLVSVEEDASVSEIAETMITNCINRVPVMRGSAMVGIVSRADIVRAIALGEHITLNSPIYDL